MIRDIEAIIFDLDGSLVDSMWMWKQIDIEYLGKFNISLPDQLQSEIEGKSFSETAIYFKERFQIEDPIDTIQEEWNQLEWVTYITDVPLKYG